MDEDAIKEILDETGEAAFEGEAFFSTDGKHTVHFKAATPEGRKQGLDWSMRVYQRVVDVLGTKAKMWEGAMKAPEAVKPLSTAPSGEVPVCGVHDVPMVWKEGGISKTTNKPYRGFWTCKERGADGGYCSYRPS